MRVTLLNKTAAGGFPWQVLVMQLTVLVLVFLDVPIVRPLFCFLYVAFVPGLVILGLLGMDKFDWTQKILYSNGLSIAFLMGIGVVLNFFGPLCGLSQPLSLAPVIAVTSSIVILLAFAGYVTNKSPLRLPHSPLSFSTKLGLLILPAISVAGAMMVNVYGNSSLSLTMLVAMAVTCILSVAVVKEESEKYYVLVVVAIGISLLLNMTLISQYIHGLDLQVEYYLFRLTQSKELWNPQILFFDPSYARTNAMLSVTILPTIYSNILNLDATWTFKAIFPLLFAFVPLGVYRMGRDRFGKRVGYIAAFLFMSEMTFVLITGLAREMIGELFFVLLLLVLFDKSMASKERTILFAFFGFGLATSHYSMALVFLFFVSVAWFMLLVRRKRSSILRLDLILLFFSIMFLWYIYIYWSTPFNSIIEFTRYIYSGLSEFTNFSSRGVEVLRGIGVEAAPTIWQLLSRIFAYAVQALIGLGVLALVVGKTKRKIDFEYVLLTILATVLLAMCILLPRFALSLNMSRFYHISLFILAPIFAIGCETLLSLVPLISKHKVRLFSVLILAVLVPYFLFQTGFVYEVVKQESWTMPLSIYRMGTRPYRIEGCYVQEQDVIGATWLSNNVGTQNSAVYADLPSVFNVLASYGMFYRDIGGKMEIISNTTTISEDSTVFLSKINVVNDTVEGEVYTWNASILPPIINDLSKVYANGGTEIYEKP